MPNQNLKKINQLLKVIRNSNLSIEKRDSALKQLEEEVNQHAIDEEKRFNASLSSFEQQWHSFEESQELLTSVLDSTLSHDVDSDEVDLLMQKIQDEVRLERSTTSSLPSDEELERRLENLRKFARESLSPAPNARPKTVDEDPIEELERLVDDEVPFDLSFLDHLADSIDKTEDQIQLLEDEIDHLPDSGLKGERPPIVPSDSAKDLQRKDVAPRPVRSVIDNQEKPVVQYPKNTNTGSGFFNSLKSFFSSIVNFFKNLEFSRVSLEKAVDNLKSAKGTLALATNRLKRSEKTLLRSAQTVQIKQQLGELNSDLNEVNKKLKVQNAALQKLISNSEMNPQEKSEKIKRMRQRISETRQVHQEKIRAIQPLTSGLNSASNQVVQAHEDLKESRKMHKDATAAVHKGIDKLEHAVKERNEECIGKQHKIKDLLKGSKGKIEQALEKQLSSEKHETTKLN